METTPRSELKRVYLLDEGDVVARVDMHVLPDLDALLLDLYRALPDEGAYWVEFDQQDDLPTRVGPGPEAVVRHFRIDPCSCGDHGWHLGWAHEDAEGWPDRADARGAFLGVMFS